MSCLYIARTDIERRAREFVNTKQFEADCRADDVNDGVHGADFMEVHFFDVNLVDLRFSLAQSSKDSRCAIRDARSQIGLRD